MKMIPEQVLDKVFVNFTTQRVISLTKHKVMLLDTFVKTYDVPEEPAVSNQEPQQDLNDEKRPLCGSLKKHWSSLGHKDLGGQNV